MLEVICTIKEAGKEERSGGQQLQTAVRDCVKGRKGQKEPQTTGQFCQFGFMAVSRPPPRKLSTRGTSPRPASFPRAPLTLPLGRVPSSLGPARGWCQSLRCAGAAAGPTQSSAARPAAGATRNPPAPLERPGSPCQTQTQRHRPRTPVEGQRAGGGLSHSGQVQTREYS